MELEFRNSRGDFVISLHDDLAKETYNFLLKQTYVVLENRKLSTGEVFKTFRCIETSGFTITKLFNFVLRENDYVKILER